MDGVNPVARSDKGLVRKDNQDAVLCLEELRVFAVADGMGGGAKGALASRMMCEALEQGLSPTSAYPVRLDEIAAAVTGANGRIFEHASSNGFRTMGTTLALLALDDASRGRGAIGHIGDSRVYRVRGATAELMTRDHSIGSELDEKVGAAAGGRFALRSNPLSHLLTRSVGTAADVQLEWRKIDVSPGDRFVICTDGVHDVIEAVDLARIVADGPVSAAADALAREIVARGAPDNYSFVIVEVGGGR